MTKHICIIEAKTYGGSWGVGDTPEEARKNAKKCLYGAKVGKVHFRTAEVPAGHKLVVSDRGLGIEWWAEPEAEQATA